MPEKPLQRKAFGSTPHLQDSRLGTGDHKANEGMCKIATEVLPKHKKYKIIVTEKLDGSCTAIAKINDQLVALGRSGYLAQSSPYEQHQLFAHWVRENSCFLNIGLNNGDWVTGEWLAQAHSTKYDLKHEPFVPFALFRNGVRSTFDALTSYTNSVGKCIPLLHPAVIEWNNPISSSEAIKRLGKYGHHHALDPVEGAVWVIEADDKYQFSVKFVRHDKEDGIYLPEISGGEPHWNWRP